MGREMDERTEKRITQAEQLVARGKLQAAIREYSGLLATMPADLRLLNRLGDLHSRAGSRDEAVAIFRGIADHYWEEHFPVKAMATYKKILKLDPDQVEAMERLAEIYRRQGLRAEALQLYSALLERFRRERREDDALRVARLLVEMAPEEPRHREQLTALLRASGRLSGEVDAFALAGATRLAEGDVEGALAAYRKGLDGPDPSLRLLREAVRTLVAAEQGEQASRLIYEVAERNPVALRLVSEVPRSAGLAAAELASLAAAPAADWRLPQASYEAIAKLVSANPPAVADPAPPPARPAAEAAPSHEEEDFFVLDLDVDPDRTEASSVVVVEPLVGRGGARAGVPQRAPEPLATRPAPTMAPGGARRRQEILEEAGILLRYGIVSGALSRAREVLAEDAEDLEARRIELLAILEQERDQEVPALANQLATLAARLDEAELWRSVAERLVKAGFRLEGREVLAKVSSRSPAGKVPPRASEQAPAEASLAGAPAARSRVFISYSHDSEDHKRRVLQLADRLREDGVDALLDAYEEAPAEGWPRWTMRGLEEADWVLLVCSEEYERRFRGAQRPGIGMGAKWEGAIVTQALYDAELRQEKFIPVLLGGSSWESVPIVLRGVTRYDAEDPDGYEALYRRLTRQPSIVKPPLGEPRQLASPREARGPSPRYANGEQRRLAEELEALHAERALLASEGANLRRVNERILATKRRLREGGRLRPGDLLLGRFRLLEPIGRGGFAVVWKAHDLRRQAVVAIKVLRGDHAEDRSSRERFFRGARKMAELQHSHVVRIFEDRLHEDEFYFFVMEFLGGGTFRTAVLEGWLPPEEALRALLLVGDGLQHAHEHGVVHRDVKPHNILMTREGVPKLSDFDLVRAFDTTGGTGTGANLGTFIYAAPEAMQNAKQAGPPADIYSLGMTALFALSGADLTSDALFRRRDFFRSLPEIAEAKPVLEKAVEIREEDRWESVRAFVEALRAALPKAEAAEDRRVPQLSAEPA